MLESLPLIDDSHELLRPYNGYLKYEIQKLGDLQEIYFFRFFGIEIRNNIDSQCVTLKIKNIVRVIHLME